MVWNITFMFHNIWDVILPIDELIFFRGVETTNQYKHMYSWGPKRCKSVQYPI